MSRELRRRIATRDAFLEVVTLKLADRVDAVAKARSAKARSARIAELEGFVAELALVARPTAPVRPRAARLDLVAWLADLLAPANVGRFGLAAEVTRSGAAHVRCDEAHLATMVLELLSNATKYARGRPVTLRLEIRAPRARIIVENAGSWAGPRGKVDRFVREERRRDVKGFGVGVWLARRLARANGARLGYASDGAVTRATLSLPLPATPRGAPGLVAILSAAGSASSGR